MFCTKMYKEAAIYVNELILTPLSPFDIKCKKLYFEKALMWKISGYVFLGHLGGCVSQTLPKAALDHGECPLIIFNSISTQYLW